VSEKHGVIKLKNYYFVENYECPKTKGVRKHGVIMVVDDFTCILPEYEERVDGKGGVAYHLE